MSTLLLTTVTIHLYKLLIKLVEAVPSPSSLTPMACKVLRQNPSGGEHFGNWVLYTKSKVATCSYRNLFYSPFCDLHVGNDAHLKIRHSHSQARCQLSFSRQNLSSHTCEGFSHITSYFRQIQSINWQSTCSFCQAGLIYWARMYSWPNFHRFQVVL